MPDRQVACINKRGEHYNPHERIENIGYAARKHSEADAIRWIETGVESYYVSAGTRTARVIVAVHQGREYLKTEADGYRPDNLLALPECR